MGRPSVHATWCSSTCRAVEEMGREMLSDIASAWNENDQGKGGSRFSPLLHIGGGMFSFQNLLKAPIPATFATQPKGGWSAIKEPSLLCLAFWCKSVPIHEQ